MTNTIIAALITIPVVFAMIALGFGILGYFVDGEILGKFLHICFNRHTPGTNPITCYHNSVMSNCQYCGKRIIKVRRDWFILEQCDRKEKK